MLHKIMQNMSFLIVAALVIVIGGGAAIAVLFGIIYLNLYAWVVALEQGSMLFGFGACVLNVFTILCCYTIADN